MMTAQGIAFEPPNTATSAMVRPLVSQKLAERSAISSDPELKLALDFVETLRSDVSMEVVEQARVVLSRIRSSLRTVSIPTISPSPAGLIGMTWESPTRHVNLQVHADHRLEVFAENLITGELWSYESSWNAKSDELIEQLQRLH